MTPFQILSGAIAATKQYGWYCGPGSMASGGIEAKGGCMMEVIAIGAGHKADLWYVPSLNAKHRSEYADAEPWYAATRAVEAVLIEEGAQSGPSAYVADAIAMWNDMRCGTQDEALRVLRKALAKVTPTPVEIIAKAADVLENGRWCKGAWAGPNGSRCADGAIEDAARRLFFGDTDYSEASCSPIPSIKLDRKDRELVYKTMDDVRIKLANQLVNDYGVASLISWNDSQKDKRKVIRLMRRTVRNATATA